MQKIGMFLFLGKEGPSVEISYLLERGMECCVLVNCLWRCLCEDLGKLAMI